MIDDSNEFFDEEYNGLDKDINQIFSSMDESNISLTYLQDHIEE